MAKYRVTPRAEDDLKNIGRYTQQHWGRIQRNAYLKNLENRFSWLAVLCAIWILVVSPAELG